MKVELKNQLVRYLKDIARKRVSNTITADDVHTFLNRNGVGKKNVNARLSYINSALREPRFVPVGNVPSSRPEARGRYITEWSI
jgi:hypothetical protein